MKKTYISPTLNTVKLQTPLCLAPGSGDNPDTAESKAFESSSAGLLWEDDNTEE